MYRLLTIFAFLLMHTSLVAQPEYEENIKYQATHYIKGYEDCSFYMSENGISVFITLEGTLYSFPFGPSMKKRFYDIFFTGEASTDQKSVFLQRLVDEIMHFPPVGSAYLMPGEEQWKSFGGYMQILRHESDNDLTWLVPRYYRCVITPKDDGIIVNVVNPKGSIMFTYGTDYRNQLAYYLNSGMNKTEKADILYKFIEAELRSPSPSTTIIPVGQKEIRNYAGYIGKKLPASGVVGNSGGDAANGDNKADGLASTVKTDTKGNPDKKEESSSSESVGGGSLLGILLILYLYYKYKSKKKDKPDDTGTANVYAGISDRERRKQENKARKAQKEMEKQMKRDEEALRKAEKEKLEKIARQEEKRRLEQERERQKELESKKKKEAKKKEEERRRREEDDERRRKKRRKGADNSWLDPAWFHDHGQEM